MRMLKADFKVYTYACEIETQAPFSRLLSLADVSSPEMACAVSLSKNAPSFLVVPRKRRSSRRREKPKKRENYVFEKKFWNPEEKRVVVGKRERSWFA